MMMIVSLSRPRVLKRTSVLLSVKGYFTNFNPVGYFQVCIRLILRLLCGLSVMGKQDPNLILNINPY